jgi:hypothetical protein
MRAGETGDGGKRFGHRALHARLLDAREAAA